MLLESRKGQCRKKLQRRCAWHRFVDRYTCHFAKKTCKETSLKPASRRKAELSPPVQAEESSAAKQDERQEGADHFLAVDLRGSLAAIDEHDRRLANPAAGSA